MPRTARKTSRTRFVPFATWLQSLSTSHSSPSPTTPTTVDNRVLTENMMPRMSYSAVVTRPRPPTSKFMLPTATRPSTRARCITAPTSSAIPIGTVNSTILTRSPPSLMDARLPDEVEWSPSSYSASLSSSRPCTPASTQPTSAPSSPKSPIRFPLRAEAEPFIPQPFRSGAPSPELYVQSPSFLAQAQLLTSSSPPMPPLLPSTHFRVVSQSLFSPALPSSSLDAALSPPFHWDDTIALSPSSWDTVLALQQLQDPVLTSSSPDADILESLSFSQSLIKEPPGTDTLALGEGLSFPADTFIPPWGVEFTPSLLDPVISPPSPMDALGLTGLGFCVEPYGDLSKSSLSSYVADDELSDPSCTHTQASMPTPKAGPAASPGDPILSSDQHPWMPALEEGLLALVIAYSWAQDVRTAAEACTQIERASACAGQIVLFRPDTWTPAQLHELAADLMYADIARPRAKADFAMMLIEKMRAYRSCKEVFARAVRVAGIETFHSNKTPSTAALLGALFAASLVPHRTVLSALSHQCISVSTAHALITYAGRSLCSGSRRTEAVATQLPAIWMRLRKGGGKDDRKKVCDMAAIVQGWMTELRS